jgi:hypothetical protein
MVYLGRRVLDLVEVFQEETLAVIHPLAGNSSLDKKCEHRYQWVLNPQLTNVYHLSTSLMA